MTIELPDVGMEELRLEPEELRVSLAIGLYAGQKVTLSRAARLAGQSRMNFMKELASRGLCLNYTVEDAEHDIRMAEEFLSDKRNR